MASYLHNFGRRLTVQFGSDPVIPSAIGKAVQCDRSHVVVLTAGN
jgi:hypothetical protein